VLIQITNTFLQTIRNTDIVGRLGGEEFGILLIDTTPSQAALMAERLRVTIEKAHITFERYHIPITISIGICTKHGASTDDKVQEMTKLADSALYKAKQSGRNRVITCTQATD
jgi:diguanylate cyclase (GGDEF)-like protein